MIKFKKPTYRWTRFFLLGVLTLLAACHSTEPYYGKSERGWESTTLASAELSHQVFLIGDAGAAHTDGKDPVLSLLSNKLHEAGKNSSVLFLGDNIYPYGLPSVDEEEERAEAEAYLKAQLDAVKSHAGNVFFIPGNHDWKKSQRGGLAAVNRQEDFVETYLGREDAFVPDHGCPGPVEMEVAPGVVILFLDTEWWLHRWEKPGGNDGVCEVGNRTEFIAALEDAIRRNRNKKILVAAHHPIFTSGSHGGRFPLKEHIFPLTAANKNLYIPFPLIGSIYPAYRKYSGSIQDIAHPEYQLMIDNFLALFEKHPNLVYASGHEHSLQYYQHKEQHYIVSGSGCKTTHLAHPRKMGFGHEEKGFTELKYYKDGTVWMEVWIPDGADGKVTFRKMLKGPDPEVSEEEMIESYHADYSDSLVEVVAGPNYEAGKLQRFVFGSQYRDTWTEPIKVPVLDLRAEHGGLRPLKKGGGFQTQSLRFRGEDGKDYVVRSIQKYPAKAIPEALRKSVAADVVQDMISIAHPFGAVAIPPLADAAGVFHTNPQLKVLPPDPILGEYLEGFPGKLYLYEERPARNESDSPWFGNSKKIYGSPDVFKKIYKDHDNQVDQEHFLRSRLFDILIGDWDRHEDQWRWASFEEKGEDGKTFKAIPRDRDQVFVKFEGLLPSIANRKWGLRKFQPFDVDTRDVAGLCFNARYVDRSFLTGLSRQQWIDMAKELQTRVTDEVIEEAIQRLPPESFHIEGESIIAKLKARKLNLVDLAERYYEVLAKEVDVVGSDKKEEFEVKRLENGNTDVSMFKVSKKGKKELIYHRVFLRNETKEIRLYGLDGKDKFTITGTARKGTMLRVIGGGGKDEILDRSNVTGLRKKTQVYDKRKKTDLTKSSETRNRTTDHDPDINLYDRRAFKYDVTSPLAFFGYNVDDGVFAGGGMLHRKYGFRKDPYKYEMKIVANYAAATGAANIRYFGDFKSVVGKWDAYTRVDLNTISYAFNFFGLSNESVELNGNGLDSNRVRLSQANTQLGLRRVSKDEKHAFKLGLHYLGTQVEKTSDRITSDTSIFEFPEEVFEFHDYAGLASEYTFTSLNSNVNPTHGFRFLLGSDLMTRLNNVERNFLRIRSEASFFFSINFPFKPTFAIRAGGATNSGSYDFYQANTIGGLQQVRGMRRNRFAGESSFYQNTEIRLNFFELRTYIMPVKVGGLAFYDIGRVWAENESSDVLHNSYGGGIWISPLDLVVITGFYSKSDVDELFNVQFGFFF